MPDKHETPRPQAVVVIRPPWAPEGDGAIAQALREDLLEVLQLLRLRIHEPRDPAAGLKSIADNKGPSLVTFTDVPALPPDCVDGALEDLDEFDVVVGPCPDDSVYLLAFNHGVEAPMIEAIIKAALDPECLPEIANLLEQSELEVAVLPPWFRIGNSNQLSFAESLARLSLMSEDGDEQFTADRLRIWFENRQ
ncbi:MAG: hypothetical protein K8I27_16315 [Planctomycetes bacterium]|nr:hypothetical protein [Planctomycetota bacterium]